MHRIRKKARRGKRLKADNKLGKVSSSIPDLQTIRLIRKKQKHEKLKSHVILKVLNMTTVQNHLKTESKKSIRKEAMGMKNIWGGIMHLITLLILTLFL